MENIFKKIQKEQLQTRYTVMGTRTINYIMFPSTKKNYKRKIVYILEYRLLVYKHISKTINFIFK